MRQQRKRPAPGSGGEDSGSLLLLLLLNSLLPFSDPETFLQDTNRVRDDLQFSLRVSSRKVSSPSIGAERVPLSARRAGKGPSTSSSHQYSKRTEELVHRNAR